MIQLNNKQFRQTGGYSQGFRIPSVSSAPGASILKDDTMKPKYERLFHSKGYTITVKGKYDYRTIAEFPRSVDGDKDSALLLKALNERGE